MWMSSLQDALKKLMKKEGFETIDGIHYTQEQYRAIHDYVLRQIFG